MIVRCLLLLLHNVLFVCVAVRLNIQLAVRRRNDAAILRNERLWPSIICGAMQS